RFNVHVIERSDSANVTRETLLNCSSRNGRAPIRKWRHLFSDCRRLRRYYFEIEYRSARVGLVTNLFPAHQGRLRYGIHLAAELAKEKHIGPDVDGPVSSADLKHELSVCGGLCRRRLELRHPLSLLIDLTDQPYHLRTRKMPIRLQRA